MTKLTVEETNLLSIYKTGSRQGLIVAMNAALPFMDGEMRGFAARTLSKVEAMTEAEFAGLPNIGLFSRYFNFPWEICHCCRKCNGIRVRLAAQRSELAAAAFERNGSIRRQISIGCSLQQFLQVDFSNQNRINSRINAAAENGRSNEDMST